MADKEASKKQVPLRLSPRLYAQIAAWAEDEFRSVNGQIEYLLTECVRRRNSPQGLHANESDRTVSDAIDKKR